MASRNSTKFLSPDPNEFCDVLNFSLKEKQAGSNSNKNNDEIIAIV